MRARGAYGARLGRCFWLASAPALVMRTARHGTFAATRITCTQAQLGMKRAIPAEDAFVVTLHLAGVRHHELWMRGRPHVVQGYLRGAISIVDLRDEVSNYLGSPFDALALYVPRALIDAVADAMGVARVHALSCVPGLVDPVIGHLGAAVLALLEQPRADRDARTFDHLAIAICAHLVHRFGGNALH
jgi:hypothetical protein